MEEIKKLIEITKKKGQRSIQLLNQNFRRNEVSKDNQLYESILNGDVNSDEEAARLMFDTDPGNRNYRNTKGKLKQKLLNHLYFLDYEKEGYTNYDKVEYECMHELHHCVILIRENAHDLAVRKLPLIIKISRLYEFVDICVQSLILLRNEYAYMGKTNAYDETNEELKQVRIFQQAVHESEELYYNLLVLINKSVNSKNKVIQEIPKTIQHIESLSKKFSSNRLDILSCKLKVMYNKLTWKFRDNIQLCNQMEKKYLHKNPSDIIVDLDAKRIAFNKLISYFFIKDDQEGLKYAEKALQMYKPGSEQYFRFIEYYFLLLMKGSHFKKAEEIFRKVRSNKNLPEMDPLIVERWNIYRPYLIFLNETKLIKWGFDLEEYLTRKIDNNLPAGYQIAILVNKFLFFLREGRLHELQQVNKEISVFSSIHLDKRHNYRNSVFIRMLDIVIEKEYNYDLIEEKAQTYFKKLQKFQIPFELDGELEVVPYEKSWQEILHILRDSKIYIHYRLFNPVEASSER